MAQSNELAAKSQQARQAMTAGRFEEAATLYKELVRRLPGNPGLRMNLGLALHSAGQYRQAVKQFQIVVKKQPDSSPARLMLALAHLKLGEPEQAINPLQQILKAEPHNRVARLELADALLSVDRAEEAAGHFRKFAELDPGSPKAWQGLGLSYIALSRRAFDRLETVAPESAYAHVLLAHSLVTRNKLHTAFHLYKQAVAKDPALRGVHAAIAGIYQKMGHADWAAVEEERERQLPRPDCASHKLECEFIAGRYRQLLETVRGQETAESYYWQSRAYGELAQQAFDRLSQMPPSAAIHDLMAETYRIQGKYELSAKEWQQALKFAPQDGRLKKGLARALWLNRDFERAQPLLEELVRLEPQSVELNFQLGDALLRGETAEKAVPYLEREIGRAHV